MVWRRFGNAFVIWLLRSPAGRILGSSTVALTITGRRSGADYTLPVNYVMERRDMLAISPRSHTWWKNLVGGAPVTVERGGRRIRVIGEAVTSAPEVAAGLLVFLRRSARLQRALSVPLDTDGAPKNSEDLASAAQRYALIRFTPIAPADGVTAGEEALHGAGVHA